MEGFREFAMNEFKILGTKYRPNHIPTCKKHGGGGGKLNMFKAINPSRSYQNVFKFTGKPKSNIVMKN